MTKRAKKTGRPSKFTQDVADEICRRLASGEPLAAICRDEKMPGVTTVWEWQQAQPELSEAIARAREIGFDVIAADCLDIADTPMKGVETVNKADGVVETHEADMLGHRKLQIETRLKLLAKWDPKRYGERLDVGVKHDASDEVMRAWLDSRQPS